jgi:hypothetical protein
MAEEMIRSKEVFKGCLFTFLAILLVSIIMTVGAVFYIFN